MFFWNSLAFSILKLGGGVIFVYLTCLSVPLSFIITQISILVIFYNKNHEVFYCTLKFQQWDEWWSSTLLSAFKRNFHQASDFIFWEFSILGINPSAEKSFNLFFSLINHWYNLMMLLCLITNYRHKENISSFQSSLCFSFLTFLVLLAIWNCKFASQILYSRHFVFNATAKAEFLATIPLVYWKVFHLYCIISEPFHSSLFIPNDACRTASILCIME